MEEPSTSHFDIDYFFSLPWHVQRSILSNVTPVDLLNLAEADESFRELVRNHPKRLHSITTNCDLNIEVYRNGITRRFWRDYYTDPYHPKKIERFRRDEMQSYSLVFCAGEESRVERDYELLLSNCKLDIFEAPTPQHQNLGIVATHIESPEVDTIDELINMLDALKATELNLLQNDTLFENNESVDKFLSNEKVLALNCLNMNISEGNLHKFAEVMIPKLLLYLHDHTDEIGPILLSLTEQLIQQWEQNEREIDMVFITLETDEEFGEDEIENILNFEINDLAHQLAFGRLGTFKDKTIDRRFKLIKRLDGTGLLIMTGAISVALIKCDYAFRRERGLGTAHQFETLRNTMENLLYQLRVTEENEERLRRYGKEPVKEYPEEVVDSVAFSIFGIETLEDEHSYEEQEESRDEKLEDEDKEDKGKSKDKIFADLEVALKEFNEYRKNITLRELSIDQLWDTTEPQISKGTLRSLVSGLRGDTFPAMPVYDRSEQRYVLEYADECLKAGRLLAYYESN